MLWSRNKPASPHDRARLVGLDLTATRARGVAVAGGHTRPVVFDSPHDELLQFVSLERRTPDVGLAGYAACRRLPHLVCANFLPQLGHAREWRGPRLTLTPEAALAAAFDKLRGPLTAEGEQAALVLPPYLSAAQVKAVAELAGKARLPLRGTASAPLAIAAHRAESLLAPAKAAEPRDPDGGRPDWVVPIRPHDAGPGAVLVVDADEFALSVSAVGVEKDGVRLLASGVWPRASLKAWKDRLIDALSDRCVRLCRRDPRDSADAEQALFEQLDAALGRVRGGHPVTLTVRAERWYQDLVLQPADFDAACAPLAKQAADGLAEVVAAADLPVPPRAVWLTDTAANLPGLAATAHQQSAESTAVALLPADAATEAAAALLARWLTGGLPKTHLDGMIPLDSYAASGGRQPPVDVGVAETGG